MNGTEWTEPGQGATVKELSDAIPRPFFVNGIHVTIEVTPHGLVHSYLLGRESSRKVTNLRLTGEPITTADIVRIWMAK